MTWIIIDDEVDESFTGNGLTLIEFGGMVEIAKGKDPVSGMSSSLGFGWVGTISLDTAWSSVSEESSLVIRNTLSLTSVIILRDDPAEENNAENWEESMTLSAEDVTELLLNPFDPEVGELLLICNPNLFGFFVTLFFYFVTICIKHLPQFFGIHAVFNKRLFQWESLL